MTLFLCQTRERELTASTSMGSECPRNPVSLGLIHISPPRTSQSPAAHPRKFACDSSWVPNASQAPQAPMPPVQRAWSHHLTCPSTSSRSATHRIPTFDPRLKFQKRQVQWSFPEGFVSCRQIISFLQSSPCLQRVLPRVGDNVIRFFNRESHERWMHLLQHKLQVLQSSVHIRFTWRKSRSTAVVMISIVGSAAHSNIISDSLITPAKNASVFFDHYWQSSSLPENSFGRPRPFTSMRLGVSCRTWAVARLLVVRAA